MSALATIQTMCSEKKYLPELVEFARAAEQKEKEMLLEKAKKRALMNATHQELSSNKIDQAAKDRALNINRTHAHEAINASTLPKTPRNKKINKYKRIADLYVNQQASKSK